MVAVSSGWNNYFVQFSNLVTFTKKSFYDDTEYKLTEYCEIWTLYTCIFDTVLSYSDAWFLLLSGHILFVHKWKHRRKFNFINFTWEHFWPSSGWVIFFCMVQLCRMIQKMGLLIMNYSSWQFYNMAWCFALGFIVKWQGGDMYGGVPLSPVIPPGPSIVCLWSSY